MNSRVISAIKSGIFVCVIVILIAIFLNFTGLDFGHHNRIWNALGKLNLINIFERKELNGLIVLSFILGLLEFIIVLFSSNKEETLSDQTKLFDSVVLINKYIS